MEKIPPPTKPDEADLVIGYKGFLLIRCSECGCVKAFCSKSELKRYKCTACGGVTVLENLVDLYANCECGKRSHYHTNVEDPTIDISCIDCGSPVSVEWNAKKKCYQTIRER